MSDADTSRNAERISGRRGFSDGSALREYVENNKEAVERLADQDYAISPFFAKILRKYERGEL